MSLLAVDMFDFATCPHIADKSCRFPLFITIAGNMQDVILVNLQSTRDFSKEH
jgi:hypothetical protein